jgi:hypothetical protein
LPPPPPQPSRPLLGEREALKIAADFARARGLSVQRYQARLDPQDHWRIEMRGREGDRARVLVDARTGKVLRAKLHDQGEDWGD